MKQIRILMGMPVAVEVVDASVTAEAFDRIYDYFAEIDATFSTYKPESAISRLNRGELRLEDAPEDVRLILALAEQTRQKTDGYFDIAHDGHIDPSGIVKGWAIHQAALRLSAEGFRDYYVDAGGDVQMAGHNAHGGPWRIGIRSPFQPEQIVKTLALTDCGIATSGSYLRGAHVYNPHAPDDPLDEIVSLTVVGPDAYEADRFATAAFAMGRAGIGFIAALEGFECYIIDRHGRAAMTPGFAALTT